ncbi:hypothetical protein PsorP6_018113 [Peronosclerospora sorghi]|uniref:Uncharacterized protein n=1 Tax=Peronosclerospora sorghi TaxID=230839 RepID=A0ACC0WFK2_9STRA|nr:hypothetical protein PsorP6_018113 [Peronosclerospora sorghi]
MTLLAARLQSTNELSDFNEYIVDIVTSLDDVRLVSVSCDGLASESDFIRGKLLDFLQSKSSTLGLMDMNHVAKALRSQIVLGSSLITAGANIVDLGLLLEAGIAKELVQVTDYTSDALVLRLCSLESMVKLCALSNEEEGTIAATGLCLFFLRTLLIGANSDSLDRDIRMLHYAEKMQKVLSRTFRSGLRASSYGLQGYQATFEGFRESIEKMLQSRVATKRSREPVVEQNNANYEGVQIDEVPCAGAQIEEKLLQLLNCASEQMGVLLTSPGLGLKAGSSPFCRSFANFQDLANAFKDYMPATFRYDDGDLGSNSKTPHTGPDELGGSEAGIQESSVISAAGVIVRHMDIRHESNPNLLLRNYPRRKLERFLYPDLDALRSGYDLFLLAKGCLTEVKARLPGKKGAIDGQTKARSLQARWFSSGSIGVIDNECENAPLEEGASSEVGAGLERNQVVVIDADSSDFFYRVLSVFRKSYNKWRICGSAPADGQTIIFAARVEKQPQLMRGLRGIGVFLVGLKDWKKKIRRAIHKKETSRKERSGGEEEKKENDEGSLLGGGGEGLPSPAAIGRDR